MHAVTRRTIENVWDYPRPPRLERFEGSLRVVHAGVEIVRADEALRVLETSHPPTYYLSLAALTPAGRAALRPCARRATACEWKGAASYFDLLVPGAEPVQSAAWTYENPTPAFAELRGRLAFYAGPLDLCEVDDEPVVRQDGDFYGGWITSWVHGGRKGIKGAPGSWSW
ncbi:MAG: DUF427 domain-containing protein [Planctomycetes bacterium]|nr:DUF427 domain-containing protein [Planctomycetota bacterium]